MSGISVKELKGFLNNLKEKHDEYIIVNGEMGFLDPSDNKSSVYRLDKPIITLYVDETEKELCFLHQSDEEVNSMIPNGTTKRT